MATPTHVASRSDMTLKLLLLHQHSKNLWGCRVKHGGRLPWMVFQGRPRTRTTTTLVTNLIGVNLTSMFERLKSKHQLFYLKCKRIEMTISSTLCLFFYNEVVRLSIHFLINRMECHIVPETIIQMYRFTFFDL